MRVLEIKKNDSLYVNVMELAKHLKQNQATVKAFAIDLMDEYSADIFTVRGGGIGLTLRGCIALILNCPSLTNNPDIILQLVNAFNKNKFDKVKEENKKNIEFLYSLSGSINDYLSDVKSKKIDQTVSEFDTEDDEDLIPESDLEDADRMIEEFNTLVKQYSRANHMRISTVKKKVFYRMRNEYGFVPEQIKKEMRYKYKLDDNIRIPTQRTLFEDKLWIDIALNILKDMCAERKIR